MSSTIEERLACEKEHRPERENYDSWYSSSWGRKRYQRRVDRFCERLQGCQHVLELGFGTGAFTQNVHVPGVQHSCMELSAFMAEHAQQRGCLQDAQPLLGDVHRLPFADQTFDAVWGNSVLHHLDHHTALKEVKRIMRPGGKLVFSEPNMLNPVVYAIKHSRTLKKMCGETDTEIAFYSWRLHKDLEALGYQKVNVKHYDFCLGPSFLLPLIQSVEPLLETLPSKHISGSLWIEAQA